MLPKQSTTRTAGQEGMTAVDDVMVKDPFCETYFPQRKAIKGVVKGETLYFCSAACRDKFLDSVSDKKASEQSLTNDQ